MTGRPQNEEPGIQSIDIGVGESELTGTWLGEYLIAFEAIAMKSWLEGEGLVFMQKAQILRNRMAYEKPTCPKDEGMQNSKIPGLYTPQN